MSIILLSFIADIVICCIFVLFLIQYVYDGYKTNNFKLHINNILVCFGVILLYSYICTYEYSKYKEIKTKIEYRADYTNKIENIKTFEINYK